MWRTYRRLPGRASAGEDPEMWFEGLPSGAGLIGPGRPPPRELRCCRWKVAFQKYGGPVPSNFVPLVI